MISRAILKRMIYIYYLMQLDTRITIIHILFYSLVISKINLLISFIMILSIFQNKKDNSYDLILVIIN